MRTEANTAPTVNGQRVVDTREAAQYLGVSHNTLEAWRSRGGGPKYVKYSRAVRYRLSDLDAFLAAGVRSNTSEVPA